MALYCERIVLNTLDSIPIYLVTADVTQAVRDAAKKNSISGIVYKPVKFEDVERVLSREKL